MSLPQQNRGGAGGDALERLQLMLRSCGQPEVTPEQGQQLIGHLSLLLRWNAKMNLTAIRDEDGILRRHMIESILCARLLPQGIRTLLDFGSGGGFPGIPCSICRPEIEVTLADSQAKKATFLRESVRSLGLRAHVYGGRVEGLDRGLLFDAVALRAVDKMRQACGEALLRVGEGGWLAVLATESSLGQSVSQLSGVTWRAPERLSSSEQQVLLLGQKDQPR